jgi:hypothetical protein
MTNERVEKLAELQTSYASLRSHHLGELLHAAKTSLREAVRVDYPTADRVYLTSDGGMIYASGVGLAGHDAFIPFGDDEFEEGFTDDFAGDVVVWEVGDAQGDFVLDLHTLAFSRDVI